MARLVTEDEKAITGLQHTGLFANIFGLETGYFANVLNGLDVRVNPLSTNTLIIDTGLFISGGKVVAVETLENVIVDLSIEDTVTYLKCNINCATNTASFYVDTDDSEVTDYLSNEDNIGYCTIVKFTNTSSGITNVQFVIDDFTLYDNYLKTDGTNKMKHGSEVGFDISNINPDVELKVKDSSTTTAINMYMGLKYVPTDEIAMFRFAFNNSLQKFNVELNQKFLDWGSRNNERWSEGGYNTPAVMADLRLPYKYVPIWLSTDEAGGIGIPPGGWRTVSINMRSYRTLRLVYTFNDYSASLEINLHQDITYKQNASAHPPFDPLAYGIYTLSGVVGISADGFTINVHSTQLFKSDESGNTDLSLNGIQAGLVGVYGYE